MMPNTCIMCGAGIPYERVVCVACQHDMETHPDDCEECKIRQEPAPEKWPGRGKRKRARDRRRKQ